MVKLDAETLYADRPKEQAYHIKMFDYCRKDGELLAMLTNWLLYSTYILAAV